MKIRELLEAMVEPQEINLSPMSTEWDWDEMSRAEKASTANKNAGWYSAGSEIEDKPHEYQVKTHFPTRLHLDGKYYWVQACKSVTNNPFIPQYYNIKLQPDSRGRVRTTYDMEKLWGIDDIAVSRLQAEIGDRPISRAEKIKTEEEIADTLMNQVVTMGQTIFRDEYLYPHYDFPKQFYDRQIIAPIRNAILTKLIPSQWDKKLVAAMQMINKILAAHPLNFELDFHAGNVLLRNTPYGLQMVITDPISDRGASIMDKPDDNPDLPAYLQKFAKSV